jgi:15-cis-phytoene synthase
MPLSSHADRVAAADLAACRALLRHGSKSFYAASLLLPRRVRQPASALYAFCRVSDDAVDQGGGEAALAILRQRLDGAYAGTPADNPVDRAFSHVVRSFNIPRDIPEAMLEGFAWDLDGRRYVDSADLEAYCVCVAGTVGVMMSLLMGRRNPATLARASDLGIAMQLTNIARDVGEDARNGRVYLPLNWLDEAGIDPDEFLAAPQPTPAIRTVTARLLALADWYYRRAYQGIGALPLDCRPAIHAARLIYAEIGREVERAGHDSITRRAVVSKARKLELLAKACGASASAGPQRDRAAAPAARGIIRAAQELAPGVAPSKDSVTGVGRMIDMFERLERVKKRPAPATR